MNKIQRKLDIEELVKKLDITPTMFKNAVEKYENLGKYLQGEGLDVSIYPQGSFSLGTVVRPYKNLKDTAYDLDFICESNKPKDSTNPKEIKYEAHDILIENEMYKKILSEEEYDKCWTLEYAEVDGIDFNMDIVPAVKENGQGIQELSIKGLNPYYSNMAIAITNKKNCNYNWSTSNPIAYKEWFQSINNPFLEYNRNERLMKILNENRSIYASIESIPPEIERSALQRVIQLLKRHRDVYFSKKKEEDNKPLSAIITTITAEIAKSAPVNMSIFELLQYVVSEFEIYSNRQNMDEGIFEATFIEKRIINRKQGQWIIMNPVNPKDNLADGWNEVPIKAKCFFEWVLQVKKDFLDSIAESDNEFIAALENGLGSGFVKSNLNMKNYNFIVPQIITSTPKHWRR